MAKHKKVIVNRPMLDALRKLMIRSDECPICKEDLDMHSSFTFTEDGKLIGCSSEEK